MLLSFLSDDPKMDEKVNQKKLEWELMGIFKKYNIKAIEAAKTPDDLQTFINMLSKSE